MSPGSLTESLRETLTLFDGAGVPRTTTEVAELLDLGRRSTYERLDRLVDHGRLETKKVGASGRVWWRPQTSSGGHSPGSQDWPTAAESLIDVLDGAQVGVFVLDADFEVAWINEATERYFGLDRERVVGRDKRRLVEEHIAFEVEDSSSFVDTVLATYDDNTNTERFECRVTAGEGREGRWLEHRSKPVETGAYAGGRVELYYDVTAQKCSEHEHRTDQTQFESLVEAVEEYAIFMLDPDGTVRTWNAGAEQIEGYTTDEVLGEHVSSFYTAEDRAAGVPEQHLSAATSRGSVEDEGWRVRADGSRFWSNVTITAIRDGDGSLQGYAKVTRDSTERKRSEAEHELLYETTRAIAEAGTFEDGLEATLHAVCEMTDWEYAEAWIPTNGGEIRRVEADYYEGDFEGFSTFSAGVTFGRGEGLPGRVWASGEFEWLANLPTESPAVYPRFETALRDGMRSSLGVPIVDGDDVVAVLMFGMRQARETDERLVETVSSVATELGNLVVRRRMEERMERESDLLTRILNTSPVGITVRTRDGEVQRLNERAKDLLGIPEDRVESYTPSDLTIRDADGNPVPLADHPFSRTVASGEPVSDWQARIDVGDGEFRWHSVNTAPILDADGEVERVVTTGRDITPLKEQARRLERQRDELENELEEVFERIDDAFYALDDEFRFSHVNDRAEEFLGHTEADLLGRTVWEALSVSADDPIREQLETAMATQESTKFERFSDPPGTWESVRIYPSPSGLSVYFTDVTERKERERELELYETITETVPDGVYALDEEDRFILVNEAFCELTGYDRSELLGRRPTLVTSVDVNETANELEREVVAGRLDDVSLEFDLRTADGDLVPVEGRFDPYQYGERSGRCGVARDVTERVERERELQEARRHFQTLVDHFPSGAVSLVDRDLRYVTFGGTMEGEETLTRIDLEGNRLRDALPQVIADVVVPHYESALDGETATFEETIGDRVYEFHFVPVRDDDGDVLAATAMAQDITDRVERERELERQRERLTALNEINGVFRGITDVVIEQSSREEIEATVCEHLADADSYLSAWIGGVDGTARTVDVRTEAGAEGDRDGTELAVGPDGERGEEAMERAIRTGEVQPIRDVRTGSHHDPWRGTAEEHGVRSSAAVPFVHGDTTYGVLNVSAERPDAFEGQEREVIGQLGEVVAHAIAAADRKRALMSDEVVELQFGIRDVFACFGVDVPPDGTITLDHTVPIRGDEYLIYGSATEDAIDGVEALVETVPHWVDVTFRTADGRRGFELRLSEPPVLSTVASLGGSIENAVIEDGDYRMTVHLSPETNVRRVIDAVKAIYPAADLLKRRQITRRDGRAEHVSHVLASDLTDRQRATLEAAYHAGFFEWPREAAGEAVAESLDIAPSTFHQHLRKAEGKVFESLLSSPVPPTGR